MSKTRKGKRQAESQPTVAADTEIVNKNTENASKSGFRKVKRAKTSEAVNSSDVLHMAQAETPSGVDTELRDIREQAATLLQQAKDPQRFRSKEKILLLTARGISSRYRHLMLDLVQLLPNSKKDAKLDTKSQRNVINEVADLKGCNNVIFFETRKHKDLYIWLAKTPSGPTIKLHCTNVHTMAELKLSGNHLKGSRPLLAFGKTFDDQAHWQILKEMLTHLFATPRGHPRTKPFIDHVLSFSIADGRVWVRNYQVVPSVEKKKATPDALGLVEVGPRMTLNPIKILEGSFAGPVIYSNENYVSPNLMRADAKKAKAGKYSQKLFSKERRKTHAKNNQLPISELADVFRED